MAVTLKVGFNQTPLTLIASTVKYGIMLPPANFARSGANNIVLNAAGISYAITAKPVTLTGPSTLAGVQVGSGGKLVSTITGLPVFLIGTAVSGLELAQGNLVGLNTWSGISAPTAANWATFVTNGVAGVASGGKPYVQLNTLRICINTACYMGYTGISPDGGTLASGRYRSLGVNDANGRPLYCAAPTGGGADPVPGHTGNEVSGDPTIYRNTVDAVVTAWLAAGPLLGQQNYVILDNHWSSPRLTSTGQVMLPCSQFATMGSGDIAYLQAIAAKYGSNPAVLIELFNELYGTDLPANNSGTEVAYLGNGHGSPVTFTFPTSTTSPGGTNGGYLMDFGTPVMGGGQTAQVISWQQALNVYRAAGGTNVCIVGCTIATGWLPSWSYNGGAQTVLDPFAPGGIPQMAASFHAYASGSTLANMDAIVAAGVPLIGTEGGSYTTGGSGVVVGSGYSVYKSRGYSGYIWFGVPSNYNNLASIFPNDGQPFANSFTMSGVAKPWYNVNVPRNSSGGENDGTNSTQIPTGSN